MAARWTLDDPGLANLLPAEGFRNYADFAGCERGEVVARSGTTVTRRLRMEGPGGGEFYLKQYRYAGPRWRHRFRRSKDAIEARNYALLRDRCGVCVPQVVAHGSRRAGWRLLDAFILTRGVCGAVPLERWWREQSADAGRAAAALRTIERWAEVIARMHRAGVFHVDLQWRNLLVRPGAPAAELFVLDSARGGRRRSPWMRNHATVRDLSGLEKSARRYLTRTQRLRWLRAYLRARGRSAEHVAPLARTIARDRARKDAP